MRVAQKNIMGISLITSWGFHAPQLTWEFHGSFTVKSISDISWVFHGSKVHGFIIE